MQKVRDLNGDSVLSPDIMEGFTDQRAVSPTGTTRVLVVDDHEVMRRGLAQLLAGTPDLRVCAEASTLAEARAEIERAAPELVLVEVSLRDGSGLDLARTLHAERPEVKIVFYSAHDERLLAERALRAGAHAYVMKTESAEELVRVLHKVAAGRVHVSERVADHLTLRVRGNHRPAPVESPVERLSDRELEVFELIGRGLATREIADHLALSVKTVETYRAHIRAKLGLRSGAEVNRQAVAWDLGRALETDPRSTARA